MKKTPPRPAPSGAKKAKPSRAPTATPPDARALALEALQAVLRQDQPLDETLERLPALALLEKRDRGFAHMLTATTLRRLGQIDDALKRCLDKSHELKAKTHDLLRLGTAQLLFLGTPPHAAVATMVELAARDNATAPFKGLINAVLRRLAREGAALIAQQDAERLNTPDWLWLSWRQAYGVAQARAIAAAHLGEAPTDLSVKSDPESWAKQLDATLLPTGSLRLNPETTLPIPQQPGFAEGAWWVQDAAAALPARLFGDVRGQTVIDLCAAPGGKTLQLAARGANVIALDRSAKRLERLKENLARCQLNADIIVSDALKWKPAQKANALLLDAPCTATGTIRRHPDAQRLKTPDDSLRLAKLQSDLLDHAVRNLLAPGGTLIYTVCSLQPEEAEQQIEAARQRHPRLSRAPIQAEEIGGAASLLTPQGDLRCLPSHWPESGGLDGFYAARLKIS